MKIEIIKCPKRKKNSFLVVHVKGTTNCSHLSSGDFCRWEIKTVQPTSELNERASCLWVFQRSPDEHEDEDHRFNVEK
jgi:hypothetical protein